MTMAEQNDRILTRVEDLAGAVAALEAADGRHLALLATEDTAALMGAAWFKALLDAAAAAVPGCAFGGILDCGTASGRVLEALELGVPEVVFTGPTEVAEKLAAIATARGARLWTRRPTSEDPAPK